MANTAQDYKVKYGYGLTTNGWSKKYPHRGNDRPAPCGTPVVIGNTRIGLSGVTGKAFGCHLHTQAGTDIACQNTFDPTPLDFKPGRVVNTGRGVQWGNFVTLRVETRYITYAHLSRIDVRVGDIIKAGTIKKEDDVYEKRYKDLLKRFKTLQGQAKRVTKLAENRGKQINKLTAENKKLKAELKKQISWKLDWRKQAKTATTSVKAYKDKIISLIRRTK